MQTEQTKRSTLPIKIGAGILLILIYVGVTMYVKSTRETRPANTLNASSTEQANSQQIPSATVYKNGTYTATGDYMTPGGKEQVTVTVTITDDKIISTTASAQAKAPASKQFQDEFINNYQSQVVGKKIAEVKLDKVSGSSLTPKGFNAAIEQIRAQSKS